jgi:drug/metabolite transporter (DMT)-like permease
MTRRTATALGILAILLWSSTVAVTRSVTEAVGPFTAGSAIFLLGGLMTLLFHYWQNREIPSPARFSRHYVFGCGALFVIYMVSLYVAIGEAVNRSQLLEIGLINYLWPVLTVAFSIPLLGNRAGVLLLPGLILTGIGISLVSTQGQAFSIAGLWKNVSGNPVAYGLALVAALSWGLYSNLSRRWGAKDGQGAVALFMLATGVMLVAFRFFAVEPAQWSMVTVWEVLFLAVASSVGYLFWDIAVRKGSFVAVSISSYFTPLLSTVIACIYLEIVAGRSLWFGCALIVAGAYLSKLGVRERADGP